MIPLTPRQRDALHAIEAFAEQHGRPPYLAELCAALGLASKSGGHRLLVALEERGAIRREGSGRHRQIVEVRPWSRRVEFFVAERYWGRGGKADTRLRLFAREAA